MTAHSLYHVAPPAGAWIETLIVVFDVPHAEVAPPAGAWIETCCLAAS
jgi:hypothetical protein